LKVKNEKSCQQEEQNADHQQIKIVHQGPLFLKYA